MDEQVQELLKAGHIREVQFPTWLSNVVLVPKATGKWRMCVDFRDLNKACPKKIKAVLDIPSPQSVREVQKLTGRIAALSRFISRSAHQSYPFFQVLRKAQKFGCDEKYEQDFQDLKKHLAELSVLVKPEPGEKLWIYLSATEHAVSSVLIREEGADQKPVYYVSHALRGAELNYSETEKIALALAMTARKLRPYFLSHPIVVLTNSPRGRIMTHAELSGMMVKWTVELGEYDIEYKPRIAIKAQALTDFLIEMTQPGKEEVWRVFVDGASNLSGCGVGVILIAPSGEKIKLALRIDSRVTNNEAEYEAVLAGLQVAREVEATRVIIYSDSQLVAQQIKGTYEAKNEKMLKYLRLIIARAAALTDWSIEQIPREENGEADTLAKLAASMSDISTREVLCFTRLVLSVDEEVPPIQRNSWMTPLIEYIVHEAVLPVEIGQPSMRVESYPSNNDQSRAIELDLVEERRDRAAIRMEAYRSRVMRSYNRHVRSRAFQVGDLIMKKVKPVGYVGKLEARWEGPFKIVQRVSSGAAYYLEDSQGYALKRPWNSFHLKKYYA
ncbi:uncharacterized protein [Primulina huaijiensis]|uniref:uncharacterized protein n=1 Tax=Primulina huaijiensis TaxID=1492673 RepID=UPI003CC76A95